MENVQWQEIRWAPKISSRKGVGKVDASGASEDKLYEEKRI